MIDIIMHKTDAFAVIFPGEPAGLQQDQTADYLSSQCMENIGQHHFECFQRHGSALGTAVAIGVIVHIDPAENRFLETLGNHLHIPDIIALPVRNARGHIPVIYHVEVIADIFQLALILPGVAHQMQLQCRIDVFDRAVNFSEFSGLHIS